MTLDQDKKYQVKCVKSHLQFLQEKAERQWAPTDHRCDREKEAVGLQPLQFCSYRHATFPEAFKPTREKQEKFGHA